MPTVESTVSDHVSVSDESKSSKSSGNASSANSHSNVSDGRESSSRDEMDEYIGTKNNNGGLGSAKILVLFCLLSLAGLTTWLWWKAATEFRQDLYQAEFQQYGEKVTRAFLERVEYRATAAAALATALSTQAVGAGLEWPFVSFSNFERRVASTRKLTQATSIWFAPFVTSEQRGAWEAYAVQNQNFLQNATFADPFLAATDATPIYKQASGWSVAQGIYRFDGIQVRAQEPASTLFTPIWQAAPSKITSGMAMFHQSSDSIRASVLENLVDAPLFSSSYLGGADDSLVNTYPIDVGPHTSLYAPIFQDLAITKSGNAVASLTLDMAWQSFWEGSLDGLPEPLSVVLIGSSSVCGGNLTYQLGDTTPTTFFVEEGVPSFSSKLNLHIETSFVDFSDRLKLGSVDDDVCQYRIRVVPTNAFESKYLNNIPLLSGIAMGAIFIFTAAVFVCYDHFVQIRQTRIIKAATKSTAIIKSLFPRGIRNKLLDDGLASQKQRFENMLPEDYAMAITNRMRLQNYLMPSNNQTRSNQPAGFSGSEPIAEFFSNVSVMYADLSGFTAWSSSREPAQVFTLLETLYGAMDKAAKRMGVFKVETIGDCYVAATGIPDPRPDHAVLMAKFANICLAQIKDLTSTLESQLGPGTGDLAFRIGIHSGPVTAGVLRGEKSRFQLFGDTMTTCAKLESSGQPGRIHTSKMTADLLIADGKGDWLEETGETIVATGRGELVTYWLKHSARKARRSVDLGSMVNVGLLTKDDEESSGDEGQTDKTIDTATVNSKVKRHSRHSLAIDLLVEKNDRLVDYNVDVMISLLKKIIAKRSVVENSNQMLEDTSRSDSIALDEVKEFVAMPEYNEEAAVKLASDYKVEIPDTVRHELRDYIVRIAALYPSNPFHNFEHASHVALSASKLLKRIVMPDEIDYRRDSKESTIEKLLAVTKELHYHTLGISSDPVAQFAVVFASLIHDVMHPGIPNARFATEEPDTAKKYRHQSIAEQRSIDIAWDILIEDTYENLRSCIFPDASELKHFRQLMVNMVMATDLFDNEMNALRRARWQRCFHPEELPFPEHGGSDAFDRKATIVLEHIIQASDVAHTMQHWHVYLKWNERLFFEMYRAYRDGRSGINPIDDWYNGELRFFDNFVIPLAHKLKDCGVFGVSSSEYLQYATENREEWERKGQAVCNRMVSRFEELYCD